MRRSIAVLAMLASVTAAGPVEASRPIGAEPIVSDLSFPAAFTFAPDGRIFYGERFTGEIRIFDPDTGSDELFFTVKKLETSGERGLLGLALHPDYPDAPFVYAYATRNVRGTIRNQILRITGGGDGGGCCPRAIFSSDTASGSYHDGGRILFGTDGMLHAIVGEAHTPANAQNLSNNAGKILRMTPGGKVPPDNPIPGSLILAYGIRNSYGFTFDPLNGRLWETENGPACNDEVNLVRPGQNYGWGPSQTCSTPPPAPENTNQDGPNPQLPEVFFTPTIAPTGAVFCAGCGLSGSEGALLFGAWNTGEVRRAILSGDRKDIASMAVVYDHPAGVLSMERGPDDALYFSDSDQIFRLVDG
jgi:aldose sugar dehydrogenase